MNLLLMEIEQLLLIADFFKEISNQNRKAVAAICIPKSIKRQEVLFTEGQKGHSVYLLATGNVQLSKFTPDGREAVIKILKPGEIFGEVILFEKENYPVNATSLRDGLVYLLPKRQFSCLLEDEGFRNDFIAMLMRKQRYLAEQILFLTAFDVEERFYRFLREHFGERDEYHILLSKKDVAAAIGTIPETFSRLLLRLRKDAGLKWEGDILEFRKGFWAQKAKDDALAQNA